jgi:protein TIF31
MRYLGKLASQIKESDVKSLIYLKLLCEEEMIARACKHILRKLMASTPISDISAIIAHFFNCLFLDNVNESTKDLDLLSLKVWIFVLPLGKGGFQQFFF